MRESPVDPADNDRNTTVVVTGVRKPLTLEVLELWLESEANGGGPTCAITDDVQNGVVTVQFEHPQRTYAISYMLRITMPANVRQNVTQVTRSQRTTRD